jgi:hypothetical protein
MHALHRFSMTISMILMSVLLLGGALVLAITAVINYAQDNRGTGLLCALGAVAFAALWSVTSWSWRVGGYWKRGGGAGRSMRR